MSTTELAPDQTTTTEQIEVDEPDAGPPAMTMVAGTQEGDQVTVTEHIGEPTHLEDLDADILEAISSCPGSTDRDLAVPIDANLTLDSSLAATVQVQYGTVGKPALIEFHDGPECTGGDDGAVTYEMEPGDKAHTRIWLILHSVITPADPDGSNLQFTFSLDQPTISLPSSVGPARGTIKGPRVVRCTGIGPDVITIWVAGPTPLGEDEYTGGGCALQE